MIPVGGTVLTMSSLHVHTAELATLVGGSLFRLEEGLKLCLIEWEDRVESTSVTLMVAGRDA